MPILESLIVQSEGRPIGGALVIWWDQGGKSDARTTDGGGFCNFGHLESGGITMTVQAPGFKDANFYKTDDAPLIYVNLEPSAVPFEDDASRPLHIEGRNFVTDHGQMWQYRGVSEFDLFPRFVQGGQLFCDPVVDDCLSIFGKGIVFRTFRYAGNNNPFALPPDWSPRRLDQAVECCRYLKEKGARVDFTAGDAQQVLPKESDQQAEVNAFYEAIESEVNAFFQTCNEPGKNGVNTARVKPPTGRVLRSSGNYDANWGDASYGGTMLDFLDIHSSRDGLGTPYPKGVWDPLAQIWAEFFDRPIVNGEPFGANEVLEPGRRSNIPYDFYRLAHDRAQYGIGVTFHSTPGTKWELFGPIVRQSGHEFARGITNARAGR